MRRAEIVRKARLSQGACLLRQFSCRCDLHGKGTAALSRPPSGWGRRQSQRSAEVAAPGLRAPEQRYAYEPPQLEAIAIEQLDMAFVSAAAVGVVNRATGPAALAILMQAPPYRLPQKFLLPAGRVVIVWIESMRCIAANDAPLVGVVGSACNFNDAVARLGQPAAEDHILSMHGTRASEQRHGQDAQSHGSSPRHA